ncbi:MAG: hypothetical protein K0Q95_1795 [Bacteroidota bacterium]|jgi:hypothetical protein|nr:hypothetical protein [Bacteroidota bacterium]
MRQEHKLLPLFIFDTKHYIRKNIFVLRSSFLLLLCFLSEFSIAQYSVEGRVIDADKKIPLAFVNIAIPGEQSGTSTDIDGKFKLSSSKEFSELTFSYVGYEVLNYPVWKNSKNVIIELQKRSYDLGEIEILPGENPAHRIIKLASANRDKNNPDKIDSYVCNTYSKTYWDLVYNRDEVRSKSDSAKVDSLKSQLRTFSENSHLLMMESVTERKYLYPENLKETVTGTKVSGFKNPSFSTSATDLQPFSFYDDHFMVLGKNYLNPITSGSTSKYFFLLQDTLFQGKDSVFVISYRPYKGKNFDGLEGVLYINSNGYAIQNVIAAPYDKGLVDIKIQQQYSLVNGTQWFPEQLNYELHYKKYPTKYVGMKLTGKSYITNVSFGIPLKKKEFDEKTVVMAVDATEKDESYWAKHRIDTLDAREKKTYVVIDSLGKKQHFDRTLKIFEALFTLQIPISIISIDLNKIVAFNDHEVIRGGIGLHTNDRLSKWFSAGGYIGYGYKDSITKYGFDVKFNLKKNSKDFYVKALYSRDLAEPGKTQYFYTKYNFNRNSMTYRMDFIEQKELSVNFRAFNYLTLNVAYNESFRIPRFDYVFLPDRNDSTATSIGFRSSEIRIKGRYAYKERFIQSFGQMLSDGTKYPIIYFAYTEGIKDLNRFGNYDYRKISAGIEKTFLIKNFGKTKVLAEAGYLNGNVPYSYLFNGNGSNSKGNYLYVDNTFQTMGLYEFLNDRYANLFLSHDFGSLLFKRPKFQPQFVLFTNIGFGTLSYPKQHLNLGFKTMEKGFYESGVLVNNLLRVNYYNIAYLGIGGGVFMRYGPYSEPDVESNLAYKFSLVITF